MRDSVPLAKRKSTRFGAAFGIGMRRLVFGEYKSRHLHWKDDWKLRKKLTGTCALYFHTFPAFESRVGDISNLDTRASYPVRLFGSTFASRKRFFMVEPSMQTSFEEV